MPAWVCPLIRPGAAIRPDPSMSAGPAGPRRGPKYVINPVSGDTATVDAALDLYDVDSIGLDRLDRAVLDALVRRFRGGPVGLSTLAVAVGEEAETIESVVEPYLVRIGFMGRTPRGRIAIVPPAQTAAPPTFHLFSRTFPDCRRSCCWLARTSYCSTTRCACR